MTVAGIASLFLCSDHLDQSKFINCDQTTMPAAITNGLKYMAGRIVSSISNPSSAPCGWYTYLLYGCERVGLAAGYKYFGTCDWYKEGARQIKRLMKDDGALYEDIHAGTRGGIIPTSFAMIFLRRGLYPILFNKLQFEGDWNNRPRDMANVTDWFSGTFETETRWQITNLKTYARDLQDSQFLYISASQKPEFTDQELDMIRKYSQQGGTILSVTECQGKVFQSEICNVYKKIFPDYKLELCKQDHPVYKSYKNLSTSIKIHILTNGVRPLVIHSDEDFAKSWQIRAYQTKEHHFNIIPNIVRYVIGNLSDLRSRDRFFWPAVNPRANIKIKLARLKHGGNWNPEPLAYERFSSLLSHSDSISLVSSAIPVDKLPGSGCKIAAMTGTGELQLSETEKKAIKEWITGGGKLVVDAANNSKVFYESVRKALQTTLGGRFTPVSKTDALFAHDKKQLPVMGYRKASRREGCIQGRPSLESLSIDGKVVVILSQHDITSGLLGYPSGAARGYDCKTALQLMRNIILSFKSEK